MKYVDSLETFKSKHKCRNLVTAPAEFVKTISLLLGF